MVHSGTTPPPSNISNISNIANTCSIADVLSECQDRKGVEFSAFEVQGLFPHLVPTV